MGFVGVIVMLEPWGISLHLMSLLVLGATGLGQAVKFIPRPVVLGFTNGIALLIASTQLKDFLGLRIPDPPSAFIPRIAAIVHGLNLVTPSAVVLPISGLQATKVSFKKVTIEWQAPAGGATFTYTVYRDGVKYGTSDAPSFTDDGVKPQRYYYYAITATGSDGSLASSVQLLVAVPSETGALPTAPPPPPPAPPVIQPTLSPSPSPSPSPRPSFIRGGGGGGGGVTTTTTTPPPPPPIRA